MRNMFGLKKFYWNILLIMLLLSECYAGVCLLEPGEHVTDNATVTLNRNKRFLIYPYGGLVKYVAGYLGPIDGPKWININAIRNVQGQFALPPKITTIYEKFNRNLNEKYFTKSGRINGDNSRKVGYQLFEHFLERNKVNGFDCLRRIICEVADTPVNHNGLVGELLQIFFTPSDVENVDESFKDARRAGEHGVDCLKMYPGCPMGDSFLDHVSFIQHLNQFI